MLWLRLTQGYYLAALEKGKVKFNDPIFILDLKIKIEKDLEGGCWYPPQNSYEPFQDL